MTGTQLTNYDAQYAAQAAAYAEQEQMAGGTFLSMRGGTLSFGEEVMPGNQVCVIILDAVKENTYYDHAYDPNDRAAPVCYAFGRGKDEMSPHPSMQVDLSYFKPQSADCTSCQWNKFGTADKGKGKACQNRRRLAMIPAGFYTPKRGSRDFDLQLFDDPKHFETADIASIKLPWFSVVEWSKYVTQLTATIHRPPHGVITRLHVEPDAKAQYLACFEMIEKVPDELAGIVMARHEQATKSVIQGYMPPREEDKQQAQSGSLRGLRRGR